MNPVIVCIAKLESDYIKEFVQYHLALGFTRIYIYDNEIVPTYEKLLKEYINNITVIHLPFKYCQYIALKDFTTKYLKKDKITHVIHIDIDEFIALKKHNNICDFIKEYIKDDCVGIGINWRFFGSSNQTQQTNFPVTQRFTMCQKDGDKHIKTLFKKENFLNYNTCHDISTVGGNIKNTEGVTLNGPFNLKIDYIKNTEGIAINDPLKVKIDYSVIQLNHYKCKTLPEFRNIRTRGRADMPEDKPEDVDANFALYNTNEVEDLTAYNFYKDNCLL